MTKGFYYNIYGDDMFIEILKAYDVHPEYYKIKYRCWNKNEFGQPFMILPNIFRSNLLKKDRKNWRPYADAYSRV